MSNDLLTAAKAEEQRLLRQLEATPLFRRLEAVRALLNAYANVDTGIALRSNAATSTDVRRGLPREGSLASQVVVIAQEYLREKQRRAQSLEILEVLKVRGVQVRGNKPTTVVASILSHSDLFDNVRGQGYGLREWLSTPDARAPDDDPSGGIDEKTTNHDQEQATRRLDLRHDLVSNRKATDVVHPWPSS